MTPAQHQQAMESKLQRLRQRLEYAREYAPYEADDIQRRIDKTLRALAYWCDVAKQDESNS